MEIGIGMPNPVPGTPGRLLVDWARQAEEQGFSSLATIDRIAYPSYESLVTLAAAAAVTDRIGLITNILLAPTRNAILLAKEAASVDQLSGGRFSLGLGVGSRRDDFVAAERAFEERGRRFDEQRAARRTEPPRSPAIPASKANQSSANTCSGYA
jgi:alkanesulfonate monooxygenase SsuD/methylene tetrahydromethanopterin reductase-like flavin-dependent oxidoreductase (luciferase family)